MKCNFASEALRWSVDEVNCDVMFYLLFIVATRQPLVVELSPRSYTSFKLLNEADPTNCTTIYKYVHRYRSSEFTIIEKITEVSD